MLISDSDYLAMIEPFGVSCYNNTRLSEFVAIYDSPQKVFNNGKLINETDARLTARSVDCIDFEQADEILMESKFFTIRNILDDGSGIVSITLKRS